MTILRWILGTLAVALGGGFAFLVVVSSAFRRSLGASPNGILFPLLPLAALGVLFAALLFPACRPLLHFAAVAAVGLVGFCLWQIVAESATVLWLALFYLAAWFVFYGLSAWRAADPS